MDWKKSIVASVLLLGGGEVEVDVGGGEVEVAVHARSE